MRKCNKISYESKQEARKDLKVLLAGNNRAKNISGRMFVYECPMCGDFHLTSQSQAKNKKRKAQRFKQRMNQSE